MTMTWELKHSVIANANRQTVWCTTSGTIGTSEVVEGFDTVAQPRIVYRYEVSGSVYTSDRIAFRLMMLNTGVRLLTDRRPQSSQR